MSWANRWDWFWLAGHPQVRSDEIHVEARPRCGPDERGHREADAVLSFADGAARPDLEVEPVAEVRTDRRAEIGFGRLGGTLPVDVHIDGGSRAQVARQQGYGALDDPASTALALRRSVTARRNAAGLA